MFEGRFSLKREVNVSYHLVNDMILNLQPFTFYLGQDIFRVKEASHTNHNKTKNSYKRISEEGFFKIQNMFLFKICNHLESVCTLRWRRSDREIVFIFIAFYSSL